MICLNNIIIYISIPFTVLGVCCSISYLCSKKQCDNNNSINNYEIELN